MIYPQQQQRALKLSIEGDAVVRVRQNRKYQYLLVMVALTEKSLKG